MHENFVASFSSSSCCFSLSFLLLFVVVVVVVVVSFFFSFLGERGNASDLFIRLCNFLPLIEVACLPPLPPSLPPSKRVGPGWRGRRGGEGRRCKQWRPALLVVLLISCCGGELLFAYLFLSTCRGVFYSLLLLLSRLVAVGRRRFVDKLRGLDKKFFRSCFFLLAMVARHFSSSSSSSSSASSSSSQHVVVVSVVV